MVQQRRGGRDVAEYLCRQLNYNASQYAIHLCSIAGARGRADSGVDNIARMFARHVELQLLRVAELASTGGALELHDASVLKEVSAQVGAR